MAVVVLYDGVDVNEDLIGEDRFWRTLTQKLAHRLELRPCFHFQGPFWAAVVRTTMARVMAVMGVFLYEM